ncbi:transcriptional regulator, LacI family [Rhizobium tibeticum]|uniref:Degradation activator n=2 Tax=Rhizobium tibeticum TaxID=501024 RepID=A0A1H8KZG1_9HYPH|nr:Degradation activator [Rhizobium tibeticum]SEN98277.1 transcriptional regulator, LacI family [Rhizobium tibeticum]
MIGEVRMTTLQQVAQRAGCSLATASRALSLNGSVSDAMSRRVRRAAAELGYRSTVAGGKVGRRPVIGVLIPSITNPVFASSLSGIENRMLVGGHGVLIAQSHYEPAREADAIQALLNDRPTGLILTLCDPLNTRNLPSSMPPTVLLGNLPTEMFPAAVTVDNFGAGYEATKMLTALGHKAILFVSGTFTASDRARLRHDGYRQAMLEDGIAALDPVQIPFVGGYDQLDLSAVLARFSPTAIIASNDLLAFAVIGALRREGLCVPRDVSVIGFDGIAIGQMMDPSLTTMEMPDASMGTTAASLLLDMAENAAPARHFDIDYCLRRGGTVRAI